MENDPIIKWSYEAIQETFEERGVKATPQFMEDFLNSRMFNKLIDQVNQDIFRHIGEYAAEYTVSKGEQTNGDL